MVSYGFVCPYHCVGPIPYVYNFVVSKFLTLWVLLLWQVIYSQLLFTSTCLVKFTCVIHGMLQKTAIFMAQTIMIAASICLLVKSCKNLSFVWLQTPIFPCFSHVVSMLFPFPPGDGCREERAKSSGRNARSPTASAILQGNHLEMGS